MTINKDNKVRQGRAKARKATGEVVRGKGIGETGKRGRKTPERKESDKVANLILALWRIFSVPF